MKKLTLTLVTPQRVIVKDKPVDSVTLPAWEGTMTVLFNHAPIMVQLKEGILKYREGSEEEFFAVYWGFAEVIDNKVMILAEDAKISSEIDLEKIHQEYEKAKLEKHKAEGERLEEIEINLKKMVVDLKISKILKGKKIN